MSKEMFSRGRKESSSPSPHSYDEEHRQYSMSSSSSSRQEERQTSATFRSPARDTNDEASSSKMFAPYVESRHRHHYDTSTRQYGYPIPSRSPNEAAHIPTNIDDAESYRYHFPSRNYYNPSQHPEQQRYGEPPVFASYHRPLSPPRPSLLPPKRKKRKSNDQSIVDEADEAPTPGFSPSVLLNVDDEPRSYHLVIRQSPKHGQMCTLGSKSRRILDPLPIVELEMRTKDGARDTVGQASPFLIMQVSLLADHIDSRASKQSPSSSGRELYPLLPPPHQLTFAHQRMIEGKLFASAQIVRDTSEEEGKTVRRDAEVGEGERERERKSRSDSSVRTSTERGTPAEQTKVCFFLFTDLSIRMCGTFRLHFSLLRLGGSNGNSNNDSDNNGTVGQIVAECTSDAFPVVPFREFEGLSESTALAKSLANQGVHIPIRNETRWRSSRRRSTIAVDETKEERKETTKQLA